ncbi:peptidoglycan-binding/hydrolyzing protein [Clostridioides difficile]
MICANNHPKEYNINAKTITIMSNEYLTISTTKVIRKGNSGKEVKAAQIMLTLLGYNVGIDSSFGSKTYNVVVSFQKNTVCLQME